jgi:hypothetical protein
MTPPNKTERRAIVDTHRHPIGPKLAARMAERGLYDPKQEFPQTNPQDLICYREFFDLDYAMPKQREGGVTLSVASNGGEVVWFAQDLLQVSTGEALKFLNNEYLEIRDRYPGEFALMANAHALEESCRPIVEEMISQGGAKAIRQLPPLRLGPDRGGVQQFELGDAARVPAGEPVQRPGGLALRRACRTTTVTACGSAPVANWPPPLKRRTPRADGFSSSK